ncbi:uncharacterized protein CPUR_02916 [Claviceps purpurea 20.1]|uniref:Uncharacterized protein n=1 Tax=Claviceps purpurea (strain 20.1) TaxID=1111077 RepID=M1W8F6_CLAP2|nr:uncharacterized protein CPUR_02916 [Claviceps purpurea 20.1]
MEALNKNTMSRLESSINCLGCRTMFWIPSPAFKWAPRSKASIPWLKCLWLPHTAIGACLRELEQASPT